MEQFTFNELIDRITIKLTESDDDTITLIYNQLFDTPVTYVGDDTWEEEFNEDEDIIIDDEPDEDDNDKPSKRNKTSYDRYDSDSYNDDDE